MSNVTIISDGTSQGTKVLVGDKFLTGVTKIELEPIELGATLRAKITIDMVQIKIALKKANFEVTDIATEEMLKSALLEYCDSYSDA